MGCGASSNDAVGIDRNETKQQSPATRHSAVVLSPSRRRQQLVDNIIGNTRVQGAPLRVDASCVVQLSPNAPIDLGSPTRNTPVEQQAGRPTPHAPKVAPHQPSLLLLRQNFGNSSADSSDADSSTLLWFTTATEAAQSLSPTNGLPPALPPRHFCSPTDGDAAAQHPGSLSLRRNALSTAAARLLDNNPSSAGNPATTVKGGEPSAATNSPLGSTQSLSMLLFLPPSG